MRLLQPWPEPYRVNARSPYGPRRHPITGKQTFHHGIDVAMPVGTPLTAGANGEIVHKGRSASAGFNLIIRHADNFHTVYYHLREPSHLNLGTRVSSGDKVAFSGNTGASTGPHLHYELRNSRKWGDTRDPLPHIVSVKPSPVTPVRPTGPDLNITGALNPATWRAWQQVLKASHGYSGAIDGIPGRMTWQAVQRSVMGHGFTGVADGIPDVATRKAVQRRLGLKDDGIWGRITISTLQRKLNGGDY